VNALVQERIAFLKMAHPEISYDSAWLRTPPASRPIRPHQGHSHQPAGKRSRGRRGRPHPRAPRRERARGDRGARFRSWLSEQARSSLFQPTISFKKKGMGWLSIARKSALLSGGDLVLVKGELGGAAFAAAAVANNGVQTY